MTSTRARWLVLCAALVVVASACGPTRNLSERDDDVGTGTDGAPNGGPDGASADGPADAGGAPEAVGTRVLIATAEPPIAVTMVDIVDGVPLEPVPVVTLPSEVDAAPTFFADETGRVVGIASWSVGEAPAGEGGPSAHSVLVELPEAGGWDVHQRWATDRRLSGRAIWRDRGLGLFVADADDTRPQALLLVDLEAGSAAPIGPPGGAAVDALMTADGEVALLTASTEAGTHAYTASGLVDGQTDVVALDPMAPTWANLSHAVASADAFLWQARPFVMLTDLTETMPHSRRVYAAPEGTEISERFLASDATAIAFIVDGSPDAYGHLEYGTRSGDGAIETRAITPDALELAAGFASDGASLLAMSQRPGFATAHATVVRIGSDAPREFVAPVSLDRFSRVLTCPGADGWFLGARADDGAGSEIDVVVWVRLQGETLQFDAVVPGHLDQTLCAADALLVTLRGQAQAIDFADGGLRTVGAPGEYREAQVSPRGDILGRRTADGRLDVVDLADGTTLDLGPAASFALLSASAP